MSSCPDVILRSVVAMIRNIASCVAMFAVVNSTSAVYALCQRCSSTGCGYYDATTLRRDKHPETSVSLYTPSPSPFLRSSQPASGKGCCVVRFYFGKVQSSGFLGVRNNRCLFLLLRFNYLAGKDKEMTHFGDQLRERREVYSALLLDWFTDDPSLVDWITIASFLYL